LVTSLRHTYDVIEPPRHAPPRTFVARFRVVAAEGVSKDFQGQTVAVAIQPPDRLRLALNIKGDNYELGRDGEDIWIYAAAKDFCVVGKPGIPRFSAAPETVDTSELGPLEVPFPRGRLRWLPYFVEVTRLPDENFGTNRCTVLDVKPRGMLKKGRLAQAQLQLWLRQADLLPTRIQYQDGRGARVIVEAEELEFQAPWPAEKWAFTPGECDQVETVARSHLIQFLSAGKSLLTAKIPTLGPPTGNRRVVATEGEGRLEVHDGTRVLFVKGSPEEMGRQHGILLRKKVHNDVRLMVYGAGIGGSLAKGNWFFGEMESAQQRLLPHMDERYLREMDALADASGLLRAEVRMANLFPELFHCSGFAIYGDATVDGRLYHGRVLDYFRGRGLEQNAVVIVTQPDQGNAWVNLTYAGFIGSVTAMNEKHVAIGEIGGRGEGQWDGKPMAQLVREVMEKADTVEQAVELMRRSPRTCEYYYVISDGKSRRAVGIRATPTEFEAVWAGEPHPQLPEPIKDAVCISGGRRLTELMRRVREGYGKFDAASARALMTRPVAMKSNIQSVLFEPETLDFWVANADSKRIASDARFTRYNLAELLGKRPVPVAELAGSR
jgi:outer membrane lipoprotein-sorting protein